MNIPTINLARTGTNIVMLRKAAGLTVRKSAVLKASFPLTYAECVKSEG